MRSEMPVRPESRTLITTLHARSRGSHGYVAVLHGPDYRVQITILTDLHRDPPPGEYLVNQPTYDAYSVAVLPATTHPSTPYWRGQHVYHGEDANEALAAAQEWARR